MCGFISHEPCIMELWTPHLWWIQVKFACCKIERLFCRRVFVPSFKKGENFCPSTVPRFIHVNGLALSCLISTSKHFTLNTSHVLLYHLSRRFIWSFLIQTLRKERYPSWHSHGRPQVLRTLLKLFWHDPVPRLTHPGTTDTLLLQLAPFEDHSKKTSVWTPNAEARWISDLLNGRCVHYVPGVCADFPLTLYRMASKERVKMDLSRYFSWKLCLYIFWIVLVFSVSPTLSWHSIKL